MQSVALALPIKPGKTEAWKEYIAGLEGRWRTEREEEFRRFGIKRNAAWLQQTPNCDMAILYWDVEDPERHRQQFQEIMTSDDEYYVWIRESLQDIFGFEPGQERPPLPEQVADLRQ